MKVLSSEWLINGSFFIFISILLFPGMCDLGKISSWLDLDSEDEMLRRDSEITLKQEIAWASHLSLQVRLLQYSMLCKLNGNWFPNVLFSHYFYHLQIFVVSCSLVFIYASVAVSFVSTVYRVGTHLIPNSMVVLCTYPTYKRVLHSHKSVSTCKLVLDKLLITTSLFMPKCLRDIRNVLLSFVSLHQTLFSCIKQC